MKLSHYYLNHRFILDGRINVLVLEETKVFREYSFEFFKQSLGVKGNYILGDDSKLYSIDKHAEIITDIFNISVNERKIINKLYKKLELISEEKFQEETNHILNLIRDLIENLNTESDFSLDYDEEKGFSELLKLFGVQIHEDYADLLEKIINFIDVNVDLLATKLFCFINLSLFLTNEELSLLYRHIKLNEIGVLFIESSYGKKITDETVIIIDKDQCEIVL